MDEIIITNRNFTLAKDKIKEISGNIPEKIMLPTFETEGSFFSFNDHKVTGQEMNDFVLKLQDSFQNINSTTKKTYDAFNDVYTAFETLDKEYMSGIIASVKAAEIASNEAKAASAKAEAAQADIKKTLSALSLTVNSLKEFKSNITAELDNLNLLYNKLLSFAKNIPQIEKEHTVAQAYQKSIYKKINLAYGIAGLSLGISLIVLFLNLIGII